MLQTTVPVILLWGPVTITQPVPKLRWIFSEHHIFINILIIFVEKNVNFSFDYRENIKYLLLY